MRPAPLVLSVLAACGASAPKTEPVETSNRHDWEAGLRAEVAKVDGGPCAKADFLAKRGATAEGIEAEVADELSTEYRQSCHQRQAPAVGLKAAPPDVPPAPPVAQPCTHARAEAEIRRATKAEPAVGAVDAAFERCVFDRVTDCQFLLDTDVEKATACWDRAPWPEVPLIMTSAEIAKTSMCLHEMKAVEADVKACQQVPVAERDGCIAPYIGYAPSCALLDATAGWTAFAAQGHLDKEGQKAAAEERRAAERAAKEAKEAARCNGHTTLDLSVALKGDPKLVPAKGCKYTVAGRVVSANNLYVELVDPTTGSSVHLLRTREPFAEGSTITDRVALYEKLDQAEMADGSTQGLPVFKLMPK